MANEWTIEEMKTLRLMAGKHLSRDIAKAIGRTREAVKLKMSRLNLCEAREPRWSQAEMERLRDLASRMSCAQAAKELGRGRTAVHWKAGQIGVQFAKREAQVKVKTKTLRFWTDSELNKLRELAPILSVAELAHELGRTVRSIEALARKLKVTVHARKQVKSVTVMSAPTASKPVSSRAKMQPGTIIVPRVVYCEVCSAPVVSTAEGWTSHYERLGCNRKAKRS